LETKDVLTGGDAAKRAEIADIGVWKTEQTANIFNYLKKQGLPTAFIKKESDTSLLCYECDMLPLELVARRYAWGSFLKRMPQYKDESGVPHRFDQVCWELFHKDSAITAPITDKPYQLSEGDARLLYLKNGQWAKGVYTDPYINIENGKWNLYPGKEKFEKDTPLMETKTLLDSQEIDTVVNELIIPNFLAIEQAWQKVETKDGRIALVDMKIEIGRRKLDNKLVIADVIDNDAWRIWPGADPAKQLDKQCFRDGHPASEISEKYKLVAELTGKW
jgi:phosphoribosylaminoimidazole-succinocarboxamide synthase